MQLNAIKPAVGAKHARKRVGRGIGSGLGKTAGLGHKGQKARAGGYHKVGFEGGQMPLQRRLPKRGFVSPQKHATAEVRLSDLNKLSGETIDLSMLKAAGIVPLHALFAKVIVSGELKRKLVLRGLRASKGAKAAIEAAGGQIDLPMTAAQAAHFSPPPAADAPVPSEAKAVATPVPHNPAAKKAVAKKAAKAAAATNATVKEKPKTSARKPKKAP